MLSRLACLVAIAHIRSIAEIEEASSLGGFNDKHEGGVVLRLNAGDLVCVVL